MNTRNVLLCAVLSLAGSAAVCAQTDVRVSVTGVIERNDFVSGTFAGIPAGAPVTMTIDLDSTNYMDSAALPGRVRGYRFGPSTFSLSIGPVTTTLRTPPSPAFFCIRNDDPRADGFFLSQGTDLPASIPLQMTPNGFGIAFLRTFGSIPPIPPGGPDPTLMSVNLLDAIGSWGFENLAVYNFAIELNEFSTPLLIIYRTIDITRCAAIQTQPLPASACGTQPASFSVAAVGSGAVTYVWQIQDPANPGAWHDLGPAATPLPCGGTALATPADAPNTQIGVSGCAGTFGVRCIVSNSCRSVTSDAVNLTVCPADFSCDGVVNSADFFDFLTAFFSASPAADFNHDAGVNSQDFFDFLAAFFGGC